VLKLNLRKTIRIFIPAGLPGAMVHSGVILSRARPRRISPGVGGFLSWVIA